MTNRGSFDSVPVTSGPRNRRIAGLVVGLVIVSVAVAIAKPWGNGIAPVAPTAAAASSPVARSTSDTASASATAEPGPASPTAVVPSAADPFETPGPPPATATWTGLRWHRLAPDDPLALVTSVLRWRGGFVALGRQPVSFLTDTPIWTSPDGAHWTPLPYDTHTTFWPGTEIGGIAEVPTGLVAMTELEGQAVLAWTSADGRSWACACTVPLPAGTSGPPLLAAGPSGLVAASTTTGSIATSTDGSHWTVLSDRTHPRGFSLSDLRGTATGYVAGGQLNGAAATLLNGSAATLWSSDGRSWVATALPLAAPDVVVPRTGPASAVTSLVVGRSGLIALGGSVTTPGAALWWQSSDGRHWRLLDGYPPLGPWSPTGEAVRTEPYGALVGDGQRMVAVRGGQYAAAWTSADGREWRRLPVTGDLPTESGYLRGRLLPGGVLLSDGSTTWFGEALVG